MVVIFIIVMYLLYHGIFIYCFIIILQLIPILFSETVSSWCLHPSHVPKS
jgi:hypothetical protein